MGLAAGTRLGPYDVLNLIGSGGMGEVYRAHDTRLHRDVAIKVLLAEVADDPDRLGRFKREAHLLASLNHPNIAQIHGLEETAEISALVMELVGGPDAGGPHRSRRHPARRGTPNREADCRGAGVRSRAGNRPS